MRFSTRARYSLRVLFMMGIAKDKVIALSMLVRQTDLSEKYLEQLLGKLKKGGIVGAVRGASGGYFLTRQPKDINIGDVLKAVDDSFELTDCSGGGGCNDMLCPNKSFFKRLHEDINALLDNYSLEDMIKEHRCV